MKYDFKIGDFVKLKPGGGERPIYNVWVRNFIKENQNKIFKITRVYGNSDILEIRDFFNEQPKYNLNISRFVKISLYDKLLFTNEDIKL